MNQILVTKNDKSKKVKEKKVREPKAPGDITGVAKAFAGIILLFGLALSADGAYAYTKNVEHLHGIILIQQLCKDVAIKYWSK